MQVAVIGQGRLGRSLTQALIAGGVSVEALHGHAVAAAPVVVITVPDQALAQVADRQPLASILVHCSGALGLEVLPAGAGRAALHPIMSYPGPSLARPRFRGVPATLVGDDPGLLAGRALADVLGLRLVAAPENRRLYHAAAVLAGNGATILLAHAARALAAAGVPPHDAAGLLLPLAVASLEQAQTEPHRSLTGPASRGDTSTLSSHENALAEAGLVETAALYRALTEAAQALLGQKKPAQSGVHAQTADDDANPCLSPPAPVL